MKAAAGQALIDAAGGFATTAQLLTVISRKQLDRQIRQGQLVRVWRGVYGIENPDSLGRLRALDLFLGREAVACLGTAAQLHGFDTENPSAIHILDPGVRVRPTVGLMVHQRTGAPLRRVAGRLATSPAWTAVEVARQLSRPRALATLDAALHSAACSLGELDRAVREQHSRRGIVAVRELLLLADGRAESPMESEARLVMLENGLPQPELQYEIRGRGEVWRVDFAWPEARVCTEYESVDWHAGRSEMLRDKKRFAGIQEMGWTMIPIVVDDVRVEPDRFTDRLAHHLSSASRRKLA
jgi:very-short-patch-repair endonuclease